MILIGMGAFVVEGYMQNIAKEVQQKQYHKNQIILEEAKAALLQYAYNYAEITRNDVNPKGPGRLPCADTDNDGQSNTAFGACTSIGRFPWAEPNLNTSDLRTTSGERLWYAVSTGFATNVPGGIDVNSDSTGTITIKDQSGNVIYDGNGAGVAAIIIAPGPPINRAGTPQDRSVSNADDPFDSTADTDPGIINASAYLDLIGTQDNATLTHGDSDDGFIIGSIGNSASSLIVNDQMIFITADEVIAMAEKAVLQAYKNAIEEYLANTGGVYPRLFNYVTNNLESFTSGVTNIGRIPSIFSNYFTSADSVPIDSEILVSVTKTFDLQGVTYNLSLVQQSANILTNVRFDNSSRLRADAVAEKMERNIYFWDD
ncbi:MAG: hypothetical protein H8E21_02640, partial [Gammaproteobacteria bacterium]|nr:hypothetical protein [Gammaproteobacteria bacterium]